MGSSPSASSHYVARPSERSAPPSSRSPSGAIPQAALLRAIIRLRPVPRFSTAIRPRRSNGGRRAHHFYVRAAGSRARLAKLAADATSGEDGDLASTLHTSDHWTRMGDMTGEPLSGATPSDHAARAVEEAGDGEGERRHLLVFSGTT